jgi:hypothetical protein
MHAYYYYHRYDFILNFFMTGLIEPILTTNTTKKTHLSLIHDHLLKDHTSMVPT